MNHSHFLFFVLRLRTVKYQVGVTVRTETCFFHAIFCLAFVLSAFAVHVAGALRIFPNNNSSIIVVAGISVFGFFCM